MTHTQKRSMIWTLAITSVALFMVSLDNLVVTTAIPVIRRDLHATISQLEWTVNAYTLTFAVLLLTGAALGDRFGRRRLFVLGLVLFTGASAAAALATTANALDIARALQGVGGAIVAPLTLTILSAGVPAERRGLALGIWGGIGGLAVALGPLVGGAVFRDRTFTLTNIASLFMFFGMFGSIFLLSQFFQTVQGYSPLQSGLRVLPWTAMPMLVAPIAGALSDRFGGQRFMAAGLALQATGLIWIAAVATPTLGYIHFVAPFTLSGIGIGLFFAPVANVVLSSVRPDQEGKASGATNAIRQLGGVFGVAVLASIFSGVGGYQSGTAFVHGTSTAGYVGGGNVAPRAARAAVVKAPARAPPRGPA